MNFISSDQLVIASDLVGICDRSPRNNVYSVLLLDVTSGTVLSRRTIPAPSDSIELIVDAKRRPVLISDRSLQILDSKSLATTRTINFQGDDSDTSADNDKAESTCGNKPFRVSVTPDSRRIEVEIPHRANKTTDLFSIDGDTLALELTHVAGFMPEFRAGFLGIYEHKKFRKWYWTDGADERPICEICDYADVLSPTSIVIGTNNNVSVQTSGKEVWSSRFPGMRDDFAASSSGNTFVILAATPNGLFHGGIAFTPMIFNAVRRGVTRLPSMTVTQTGNIQGGSRSAVAMSSNGLQVALFLDGRITLYTLKENG